MHSSGVALNRSSSVVVGVWFCHVHVLCLSVHHKHWAVIEATSLYATGNADQALIPTDIANVNDKDKKSINHIMKFKAC